MSVRQFLLSNTHIGQVVVKNTSWQVLGQVVVRAAKFGVVVFAARELGAAGFGTFSFIFAFLSLFFIAASVLGALSPFIRDTAAGTAGANERASVLSVRLILGGVAFLVGLITYFIFHGEAFGLVALLLSLSALLDFVRDYSAALLQARHDMQYIGIMDVIQAVILVVGFLFIFAFSATTPSPLVALALIYFLASAFSCLYSVAVTRREFPAPRRLDRKVLVGILKESVGFGLAWALFISFFYQVLLVYLGWFTSEVAVGTFAVALQIITVASVPAILFATSLVPVVSAYMEQGGKRDVFVRGILLVAFTASVPIGLGIFSFAEPFVQMMFSSEFASTALALQLVVPTLPFLYIIIVSLHIMLAVRAFEAYIPHILSSAAVVLIASGFAVYYLGLSGAIISFVCMPLVVSVCVVLPWLVASGMFTVRAFWKAFTLFVVVGGVACSTIVFLLSSVQVFLLSLIAYVLLSALLFKREFAEVREIYHERLV